jgi:ABC-type phosphate transport system substrate-binding protein
MAELAGVMVGNYFLLECLESQGAIETYRARPTTRGGCDALVRMYHPPFPDTTGFAEHFMQEAGKVWRCRHEHIQPLVEFGAGGDLLYSVTELTGYESLEQFVTRWEQEHAGQALPAPLVMRWTTQLCAALQAAHEQGIAHGNVQMSSILVEREEDLLLANFSMRHIQQEPGLALTEHSNAAYAAPEQSIGIVTQAGDIYAMGVLLYRLFTGRFPYDGVDDGEIALQHTNEPIPSLREIRAEIPEAVEMVVRVALAKAPAARFPSASALAKALLAALVKDEQPVVSTQQKTIQPRRRVQGRAGQARSAWAHILTLTSILVMLSGLVGVLVFFAAAPFHLEDIPLLPFGPLSHSGGISSSSGAGVTPTTTTTGTTPTTPGNPSGSNASSISGSNHNPSRTHRHGNPPANSTPTAIATGIPITPVPTTTGTTTPPNTFECSTGTLSLDGTPYVASLLSQVNQDYLASCPGLQLTLRSDGLRSLTMAQDGQIDAAYAEVTAKASRGLVDHPVAALLFTLIASPDIALDGLNSEQIQDIYAGHITNWSQVGGPDEAITLLYPPAGAPINAIFRSFVLNGAPLAAHGRRLKKDDPALVVQAVSRLQGALSYVPLAYASQEHVQTLSIDGNAASAQAVASNAYPFWSIEHIYTAGDGTQQTQAFMQFILSQQENETLLNGGAVPIAILSTGTILSHLPGPEY